MAIRVVVAAVVGAVALSVLEALTYGLLLPEFIDANRVHYPGLIKDPPDPVAGILFNLVWSTLLAFVFDKWPEYERLPPVHRPARRFLWQWYSESIWGTSHCSTC